MENVYCVIMAGGVGSRFWPLSTGNHPKQFIDVLGIGETLLQGTFRRFNRFVKKENIYIVTNAKYKDLTHQQLPDISEDQVLLEPAKRNTAPCIEYATSKIMKNNKDAVFVISPADHLIVDEGEFQGCVEKTIAEAQTNNVLCTLGIKPHKPSTSYGYIQFTEDKTGSDKDIKKVKSFTEKPNLEHAKMFLESGDFLWNSGIFIWSGKAITEAFEKYLPDTHQLFEEGEGFYYTPSEEMFIKKIYPLCQNESIDYAVMEKADNVYVLPVSFGWNDLGTWGSVYEFQEKNKEQNVVVNNNAHFEDAHGNIVSVSEGNIVVIDGLKNYIIAESDGKILIVPRASEEKIKNLVNHVKNSFGERFV